MNVEIKMLAGGTMPRYGKSGDAAMDVFARANGFLQPGISHTIPLGFCMAIPPGHVGLILGRSGLAAKQGIAILGGVIDSNYRGEFHAVLLNTSISQTFWYSDMDRIAQLLIVPCVRAELVKVDELDTTERGTDGFGSSGK